MLELGALIPKVLLFSESFPTELGSNNPEYLGDKSIEYNAITDEYSLVGIPNHDIAAILRLL